jgi:hypothetical protein
MGSDIAGRVIFVLFVGFDCRGGRFVIQRDRLTCRFCH